MWGCLLIGWPIRNSPENVIVELKSSLQTSQIPGFLKSFTSQVLELGNKIHSILTDWTIASCH